MYQNPLYTEKKQRMDLRSVAGSSIGEYVIGDQVEHKLFGKGKIMSVEGVGDTAKLTICFRGNVRKKLIAKYAKLIQLQA